MSSDAGTDVLIQEIAALKAEVSELRTHIEEVVPAGPAPLTLDDIDKMDRHEIADRYDEVMSVLRESGSK